ncbi:hypothetical protein [Aquabacter cavernae]|uniref:hypothetical protein n=1 Tax=Aquabacter cavernae TaxID=2496029 RepID=UPI000F8E70BC|nr:hypothetical protein [Aquabacter cavernae]
MSHLIQIPHRLYYAPPYHGMGLVMATCKLCGKSGWFLKVNDLSLCQICAPDHDIHIRDIAAKLKYFAESAGKPVSINYKIQNIISAISECNELIKLKKEGLLPHEIDALGIHRDLDSDLKNAIQQLIADMFFDARMKAKDASTDAGKLGGYAKSVERLVSTMGLVSDVTKLERAILDLRSERDLLKVKLLQKKADAFVAKGNNKKAIDVLIDALIEMRHDTTPDGDQAGLVRKIESRIISLGGSPPIL